MNIYILAAVTILLALGFGLLQIYLSKGTGKLPYYKTDQIQTPAEFSFFKVLEMAVGSQYYIFPQVRILSLIKISATGKEWFRYFGKVSRKSVDFVLADKKTTAPILVIELDDASHNEEKRQDRDSFVDTVFQNTGIPFLRIKNSSGYSTNELQRKIGELLQKEFSLPEQK